MPIASELKKKDQFRFPGQRKWRTIQAVWQIDDREGIPAADRGKTLITFLENGKCRQIVVEPDQAIEVAETAQKTAPPP